MSARAASAQHSSPRHGAEDHDSSSLHFSDSLDASHLHSASGRSLDEQELRRHLGNVDSGFLPNSEFVDEHHAEPGLIGADDTYLIFGESQTDAPSLRTDLGLPAQSHFDQSQSPNRNAAVGLEQNHASMSHHQPVTSSPAAAAAQRSHSRVSHKSNPSRLDAVDMSRDTSLSPIPDESFVRPEDVSLPESEFSSVNADTTLQAARPGSPANRSAIFHSRNNIQPSFPSSNAGHSDASGGTDSTLNVDYALHTGGALPSEGSTYTRPYRNPSRLPSLASIASDMSRHSDRSMPTFNRMPSAISSAGGAHDDPPLEPLHEEPSSTLSPPLTPRIGASDFVGATDTVIAQHVQNIRVPETIAQEFRQRHPHIAFSPEKRPASSLAASTVLPRPHSTLTLKEQNSKVDKLSKENFDLKLKIHFLDQALQNRSDEGIKNMINQNVQFQTDLIKERKENQTLKRRVRELESRIEDLEDELAETRQSATDAQAISRQEIETVISEMTEKIELFQARIAKISAENAASEIEKRKRAEHIAAMEEHRGSDYNALKESAAMWKDMLAAETDQREQADHDNRRLREEVATLRHENANHLYERRNSVRSPPDALPDRSGSGTSSSITLVDQLRLENMELRRDLGAQTSMLTSRNKERERLQQEIEDLKVLQRKADSRRPVSSDSGFERSGSRALNRLSTRGAYSQLDELERDENGKRESALRDKNARLTLDYRTLEDEFKLLESELNAAVEDLQSVQKERDEALRALEDRDTDFEKLEEMYKELEEEAVLKIEGLEENLEQADQARRQYRLQLEHKDEDFAALQDEYKNLGSKHQRLEFRQESLEKEISFLREEQDSDKVKIGDLENSLHAAQQGIMDERGRVQELQSSLDHERTAFERINAQSKEHQRILDEVAADRAQSKDDALQLRRMLSVKEREAKTYQTELEDLDSKLRHILGDAHGTYPSLLQHIEKLQGDMARTLSHLDEAKSEIAEKERLIKSRDAMLENTSLESRHLSDLLEKERRARKNDLHQFELSLRGNSAHLRIIAQHETKVLELEAARTQDKRRAALLEQQYRDQLNDRNNLLNMLWNRLSTLCGTDWTQMHNLANGQSTTPETIAHSLPTFKTNVVDAIKKIEYMMTSFKTDVRTIEKRFDKDYATLEQGLSARSKRIDHLERALGEAQAAIEAHDARLQDDSRLRTPLSRSPSGASKLVKSSNNDLSKLKQEIKVLKAELDLHRQHPSEVAKEKLAREALASRRGSATSFAGLTSSPKAFAKALLRHHSNPGSETSQQQQQRDLNELSTLDGPSDPQPTQSLVVPGTKPQSPPLAPDARWAHRYKELEKRLKAEREARLLDRRGARQRLEEREAENEDLQAQLRRKSAVSLTPEFASAAMSRRTSQTSIGAQQDRPQLEVEPVYSRTTD